MKVGDTVKLREPVQGRFFKGRIQKIKDNIIRVNLPNGYYVEFPKEKWVKTGEELQLIEEKQNPMS